MLSDEALQKLLFDLFCLWHDVQRHYDPPITHNEEEKMKKVYIFLTFYKKNLIYFIKNIIFLMALG